MEVIMMKENGWFFNPQLQKYQSREEVKMYGVSIYKMLEKVLGENRDMDFYENRQFTKAFNNYKRNDIGMTSEIKKEVKITPVKKVETVEVEEDNDKSFIQLFKSMTNDGELLNIMRNCMTLYLYLAGNIQRNPRENDSFNIYENYYKKDILAFAETETVIIRKTGISRRCISRYVNHMEKHGIIEIDKKMRTTQEGTKEHNIYILGTVTGNGNYNLFINKKGWKTPHNILGRKQESGYCAQESGYCAQESGYCAQESGYCGTL